MKAGSCKHFSGIQHKECRAGVNYAELGDDSRPGMACRLPCLKTAYQDGRAGPIAACEKFEALTQHEEDAREAEIQRGFSLFARGLSPCCEARLDAANVLRGGRFKGNGWLRCSKCHKNVSHVHGLDLSQIDADGMLKESKGGGE